MLKQELLDDVHRAYEEREAALGSEVMRELERRVLLSVLDRKWREHLYEMDYLRAGIHLRAMANRDPVVEYQREGYDMFMAMLDGIKEESVGFLFNLEVKTKEEQDAEAKAKQDEAEAAALAAAQEGTARVLARQEAEAEAKAAAGARPARRRQRLRRHAGGGRGREAAPQPAAARPRRWSRRRSRRAPGRSWRSRASTSRAAAPSSCSYSAPTPGRLAQGERRGQGGQDRDGDRHQGAGAQRALPLRLGQEVQVLPRSGRFLSRARTAPPPIDRRGRCRFRMLLSRPAGRCSASGRRCPPAGRRRRAPARRGGRRR